MTPFTRHRQRPEPDELFAVGTGFGGMAGRTRYLAVGAVQRKPRLAVIKGFHSKGLGVVAATTLCPHFGLRELSVMRVIRGMAALTVQGQLSRLVRKVNLRRLILLHQVTILARCCAVSAG